MSPPLKEKGRNIRNRVFAIDDAPHSPIVARCCILELLREFLEGEPLPASDAGASKGVEVAEDEVLGLEGLDPLPALLG